jgi:hypothetical protein
MSLWKNNIVEMRETNSFLYEIEIHSMYLNSIQLNLNSISIQQLIKFQWIDSNSIKDKWYANWWRIYWISSCEYGVRKRTLKRHKFENTLFYASSFGNKQIPIWNCPMYDNLKNLKLSYLN